MALLHLIKAIETPKKRKADDDQVYRVTTLNTYGKWL